MALPKLVAARRRAVRRAKAARRRRRALTAGITIITALAVGWVAVFVALPFFQDLSQGTKPLEDYPGPGGSAVQIVIRDGQGGTDIAQTLAEADVVATAKSFVEAYRANPKSVGIQPGTYTLHEQMRAADAVGALLDVANRLVTKVTIPEGWRASQIYERLAEKTGVPVEELAAAVEDPDAIGLPPEADGEVEGWLFPATYEFDPNPTAADCLKPMIDKTVQVLEDSGVDRAKWNRTLILASLIEKEAKLDDDRPKVSRVFRNRLKADMKLESDATVSYGVERFDTASTTDDERADDNPWNTYVNLGLPVTAICNPGEASILAALSPAKGKWLYFVVVNEESGETEFNETYEGHLKSVAKWQQWRAEHPEF